MKNIFIKLCIVFVSVFVFSSVASASDVSLVIRDGSSIVFSGTGTLAESGNIDIPDSNGTSHVVNAQSVLGFLYALDQADSSWEISDLTYFDSFGSFYVKCIDYSGGEKCDNWQYVVDGSSPFSSIDQYELSGGEEVYLYFGYPHQVSLSKNTVALNESFTATAENYDYENDVWEPLTGVTLGIVQDNPSDPFNPTEITTSAVDSSGMATFSLATSGEYKVGIKEDFYFPTFALTVSESSPEVPSDGGGGGGGSSGGGGGGGSSSNKTKNFDVIDAVKFLDSEIDEAGSFGRSPMYTDWVAVAYGAVDKDGEVFNKMLSYLKSNNQPSEILTDNERRALALLAIGENPYSFSGVNYIDLILKEFDDVQFGEPDLVNDDVFAVLVLSGAGFTEEDEVISKAIDFILSEQKTNGSWEGSVDMTSATVQALSPFEDIEEVAEALTLAENYLQGSQKTDGGWGSVYSTSWALQAGEALGESWKKDGKTGEDYLGFHQQSDGGMLSKKDKDENRIWATAYAIPASLGKSWTDIIKEVPKQESKILSTPNKKTEITEQASDKKIAVPVLASFETKPPEEVLSSPSDASIETGAPEVLGAQTASVIDSNGTPGKVATSFAFGLGLGLGLGILLRRFKTA